MPISLNLSSFKGLWTLLGGFVVSSPRPKGKNAPRNKSANYI